MAAKAWLKSDLAPVAILLSLPALLFWKLIFAGEVLYWGTPLLQFFPWRKFAVESYLAGAVPLWNPYLGNGSPLAANWQSAVFYPLNAIYLLFSVERAMGYSVALHIGLAGAFMYVFGRTWGLTAFGSLVAGLGYAFGGFLVSRAGFLSMTSTAPWLPLILAITEVLLRQEPSFFGNREGTTGSTGGGGSSEGQEPSPFAKGEGRVRVPRALASSRGRMGILISLGSLAVGLQLLAGHGQLAFYSLLLAIVYALYRSWQLGRYAEIAAIGRRLSTWFVAVLPVPAMLVLGLGIAAVQLLPTAELALSSVRAGGLAHDFAMAYSLYPWQLVSLLAPDFFGNPASGDYWGPGSYWEASGYIGVLPLVAAGVGLLVPARRSGLPRLFFFGVAVVSLVFALGRYLPVYPLIFTYVPGFGLFQAPARFLFWYTLAAAILAGIGADALLSGAGSAGLGRLGRAILLAGVGISLAMAVFILLLGPVGDVRPTFVGALAKLGVLLAVTGLLVSLGGRLPKGLWQVSLGLFMAADLLLFGLPLNPTTPARAYDDGGRALADLLRAGEGLYRVYTPDAAFLEKFFATHRFRSFGSSEPSDVKRILAAAIPDVSMAYGVQESSNYDPLQVGTAKQFLEVVDSTNLDSRLLGLMNARYVLSDTLPSSTDLKPVRGSGGSIYENPRVFDRAFVVDRATRVSSTQKALQEVQRPEFDPRQTVVLTEPRPSGGLGSLLDWLGQLYPVSPAGSRAGANKRGATLVEYGPHRVLVATRVDTPGYLVLADTYYPGWQAWVNGKPAAIHRANAAFRAVELPSGESLVEFRYEPATFKLGATATALSLAVAVAIAIWPRRRRGRS